jgi:MFS family permease
MAKFNLGEHKQLRRLVLAGIPADFADWLDYVAIVALLAYTWQSGPWSLALLALALGTPYLIVGPFAGALVDKVDLRLVLIFSNLGRALVTATLIFAPDATILLMLVFLRASIDSAFTPARQATIQALTNEHQLGPVNALVYGFNQLAKVAGPALGGLLLALLSPQWIFALNALVSLVAASLIWNITIPARERAPEAEEGGSFFRAFAGFQEVLAKPKLLMGIMFVAVSLFAVFLYDTFIVLLAVDFGFSASVYGWSIAAVGGGGVAGALLVARVELGDRHLRLMAGGAVVSGVAIAGLGLLSIFGYPVPMLVFLALFFGVGVCTAFMQIPYRALVQREASASKMARVVAAGEAISVIAMLSAPLLGGLLVAGFGAGFPFALGGGLLIVVALFSVLFKF